MSRSLTNPFSAICHEFEPLIVAGSILKPEQQ
jgi:hypothetical protein